MTSRHRENELRAASKRTTDFVGAEQVIVEVLNNEEIITARSQSHGVEFGASDW